jgi:hypothetical protein
MADDTWNKQVATEKSKYMQKLFQYRDAYLADSDLAELVDTITTSAANRALNAAYGGEHHDGGASSEIKQLSAFLDGVLYAETGKLLGPYAEALKNIKIQQDPEYQKYQELKKKFEGK